MVTVKEENESTCHVDDCSKISLKQFSVCQVDVDVWHVAAYEVWWDDEGEADEEEEAGEDEEVGGEEGASQVSVLGDFGWDRYK